MCTCKRCSRLAAVEHLTDAQVCSALSELKECSRLLVFLIDVEHRSYAEAGSIVGIPAEAVAARLHRARGLLLRRFLGPIDHDDHGQRDGCGRKPQSRFNHKHPRRP